MNEHINAIQIKLFSLKIQYLTVRRKEKITIIIRELFSQDMAIFAQDDGNLSKF